MQTLDGQLVFDLPEDPEAAPAIGGPYAALLEDARRKRRRQPRKVYTVELRETPGAGVVEAPAK
jgi:hypothetical protein